MRIPQYIPHDADTKVIQKRLLDICKALNGNIDETNLGLTDVQTWNVSQTAHGFVPKLPGNGAVFLDGTGQWSNPAGKSGGFNPSDTTPAPPAGGVNVKWQKSTSTPPTNSAYILIGSIVLAGDVTGPADANKVVAIQNVAVDSTAPTNGQVLTYDSGTTKWKPATPSAGGGGVNRQTGTSYTILASDLGKLVSVANAAPIAITLPIASSFVAGFFFDFENTGAGAATITPTTSTIDGAASIIVQQHQGIRIFSDGTNFWTMRGRLVDGTAAGQVLIWDNTNKKWVPAVITPGSGIAVTNSDGAIQIAATGTGIVGAVPVIVQSAYARSNTTATITISAPVAGNILLFVVTGASATITPPATVNRWFVSGTSNAQQGCVFYRNVVGGDPTTYAFTGTDYMNVACYELSGCFGWQVGDASITEGGTPTFGSGTIPAASFGGAFVITNSSKTVTGPGVVTKGTAALCILAYEWDNATAVSSTSLPAGWVTDHDFSAGSPAGNHYGVNFRADTNGGLNPPGQQPSFTTAGTITTGIIAMTLIIYG